MTTEELRTAYPNAIETVLYHEMDRARSIWALLRGSGKSPPEALRTLLHSADRVVAAFGPVMVKGVESINWVTMRQQMEHPDFLKYIAAKLGAL